MEVGSVSEVGNLYNVDDDDDHDQIILIELNNTDTRSDHLN